MKGVCEGLPDLVKAFHKPWIPLTLTARGKKAFKKKKVFSTYPTYPAYPHLPHLPPYPHLPRLPRTKPT